MLESIWLEQLFLGASAIGPDCAIYSVDSAEASLNQRMLTRSAQRYVLADSSKFGAMATYKVAPLASSARVITDAKLSTHWRGQLAESGVETTIAEIGSWS
jgi:DeoR family fructose operon transcriptional repressor